MDACHTGAPAAAAADAALAARAAGRGARATVQVSHRRGFPVSSQCSNTDIQMRFSQRQCISSLGMRVTGRYMTSILPPSPRTQQSEGSADWLRSARAFGTAFDGTSQGMETANRLAGVQGEEAVRYVGELAGDHSKSEEYRFALFPHMSGFDASAGGPTNQHEESSRPAQDVNRGSGIREASFEE